MFAVSREERSEGLLNLFQWGWMLELRGKGGQRVSKSQFQIAYLDLFRIKIERNKNLKTKFV